MNKFRYIDKKILCSYDLSEEFFKELGVEVYDIIPLRKVFVIFTDKGKKILKKIKKFQRYFHLYLYLFFQLPELLEVLA